MRKRKNISGKKVLNSKIVEGLKKSIGSEDLMVAQSRLNDISKLNAYLKSVNKVLPVNGYFIGFANQYIQDDTNSPYDKWRRGYEFFVHRVLSKLKLTSGLYRLMTRGKNQRFSKTEILGRLCYSGFEIVRLQEVGSLIYFIVRKKRKAEEEFVPNRGLLFKMQRAGKNGRPFTVFKVRTMHPYAQFLQEYIYNQNDLQEGGKFKDDFRVSDWGRVFRKYFIDELPMLWNVLKGEMKLIGVRPLSKQYLSLYTEELKEIRQQTTPGLLPPYYADMPKTLEEVMESEWKYLKRHRKAPFKTDFIYFFKILNTILIKRARSK